jgi:hypothetical protein
VTFTNRDLIVALAARLRLPALYPLAFYTKASGLISYGFDPVNQFQQGAGYVDRILRGAKPADLGAIPDEVSTRHQSQDRQNTRPCHPGIVSAACRRGNRMSGADVRYWHLADMRGCTAHVCF